MLIQYASNVLSMLVEYNIAMLVVNWNPNNFLKPGLILSMYFQFPDPLLGYGLLGELYMVINWINPDYTGST